KGTQRDVVACSALKVMFEIEESRCGQLLTLLSQKKDPAARSRVEQATRRNNGLHRGEGRSIRHESGVTNFAGYIHLSRRRTAHDDRCLLHTSNPRRHQPPIHRNKLTSVLLDDDNQIRSHQLRGVESNELGLQLLWSLPLCDNALHEIQTDATIRTDL